MRKSFAMLFAIALVLAAVSIGVYLTEARAQVDRVQIDPPKGGDDIEDVLMKALDPAPGAPIQIAPMAKKGEATPGMWTTIPNGIFGGMLARTGILPGVSAPSRLRGRPGFLDFVGDSEVLNKGGTRATVGYFIKVSRDTQLGNIPVEYFVLMSYDNIKTADGKQLNAFEFFLFGPVTTPESVVSFGDPPPLLLGLAINADGKLLDSVPLELAKVKNFVSGARDDDPVTPGVNSNGFNCLQCHGRDDQFPETTLPFPWIKPETSIPLVNPAPGVGGGGTGGGGRGQNGGGPEPVPGENGPSIRIPNSPPIILPQENNSGRGGRGQSPNPSERPNQSSGPPGFPGRGTPFGPP